MTAPLQIRPDLINLFNRISGGDEAAFTEVFYYYTPRIYHFILGKAKSRLIAEEIVQEVFTRLWSNRGKLNGVSNPESYIYSIAVNQLFDWLKKMAHDEKIRKRIWENISDCSNVTAETLDLQNAVGLVQKALAQLSPQRRTVYLLSRQDGLSHSEIAKQMNLSEKTVNNHLTEALRFIRGYLENT